MNKLINETQQLRYRVVLDGKILHESVNQNLASNFVSTLTIEQQQKAQIVPITENGHQVLLG